MKTYLKTYPVRTDPKLKVLEPKPRIIDGYADPKAVVLYSSTDQQLAAEVCKGLAGLTKRAFTCTVINSEGIMRVYRVAPMRRSVKLREVNAFRKLAVAIANELKLRQPPAESERQMGESGVIKARNLCVGDVMVSRGATVIEKMIQNKYNMTVLLKRNGNPRAFTASIHPDSTIKVIFNPDLPF